MIADKKAASWKKVRSYNLMELLGKGQFGEVYKATKDEEPGKLFAVKCMPNSKFKSEAEQDRLRQEIETHKKLRHLNIVLLMEKMKSPNSTYLVMEYCKDGDLESKQKRCGPLSEEEALYYLMQMLNGGKKMWTMNIIHRDIKLPNFLLHDDLVKFGDFGLSRQTDGPSAETQLGSEAYQAPEFQSGKPYTNKVDIWSLGCVFYELLFGAHPFSITDKLEFRKQIEMLSANQNGLVFPKNIQVSQQHKDLLNKMLKVNPIERISWDEMFNHSVFSSQIVKTINSADFLAGHKHAKIVYEEFKQNQETHEEWVSLG